MNNLKTNRECNIIICVTIMLIISFSLSNCHKLKFPPSEFEIGDIYLGSAFDLYLEGDYAYVMYNEGMAIIDISDLNKPNKITIVKTEESAYGILLKNNIAFLGSGGENNFKINNISNKKDPDILSELSVQGAITAIAGNENM